LKSQSAAPILAAMQTEPRHSAQELDAILQRLRQGDLDAMALVTRENVIPLLDRANKDDKVVKLLKQKL
jgi:hypothetical protein